MKKIDMAETIIAHGDWHGTDDASILAKKSKAELEDIYQTMTEINSTSGDDM